jgi:hypothetical protein
LVLVGVCTAAAQKNKAATPPPAQTVDSGTFGIFVGGKRVATENFSIQQRGDQIVATSELITESSGNKPAQRSEMLMAANGDLKRYHWRETPPSKAEMTVDADEVFLIQKISANPPDKPIEMTHMVPPSTVVLDDYFFMHRQLLLWRYLGGNCGRSEPGECKLAKAMYGIFVPRQHVSGSASLQFIGQEKVNFGGSERELARFSLISEDVDWSLWVDDQHRIVRVAAPALNLEVLRE